jgi:hypothetical protein
MGRGNAPGVASSRSRSPTLTWTDSKRSMTLWAIKHRVGVSASPDRGLIAVTDINGDHTQDILTISENVNMPLCNMR